MCPILQYEYNNGSIFSYLLCLIANDRQVYDSRESKPVRVA